VKHSLHPRELSFVSFIFVVDSHGEISAKNGVGVRELLINQTERSMARYTDFEDFIAISWL
jgi:hypothetical protein